MADALERYLAHIREELDTNKKSVEMIKRGDLKTGERSLSAPQWRDTTAESLARAKQIITTYEDILAQHAQGH